MSAASAVPATLLGRLRADVERRLFTPARAPAAHPCIGLEIECLPLDTDTGRIVPIDSEAPRSTVRLLRAHGGPRGWIEERSAVGAPTFRLPDGGRLSFEPGGQLEYSSPVCGSGGKLLRRTRLALAPLARRARDEGIELRFAGIDPLNPLDHAPLQLHSERYRRMAAHFALDGPAGGRMMRQTAAIQVSVDLGERPFERWTVLNAAAPCVAAIFANSPVYAGRATGRPSERAHVWRTLDPLRTGLPWDARAPVDAYLEFALRAPHFLRADTAPFAERLATGGATLEEWQTHLTTLFPEVRPRGWFEVRSADTLPLDWLAAPIALLGGLAYDPAAQRAAAALLGAPEPARLSAAADAGLAAPGLAGLARDLFEIALRGCERLGLRLLEPAHLAEARAFYARFTARGRAPADEVQPAPAPPPPVASPPSLGLSSVTR